MNLKKNNIDEANHEKLSDEFEDIESKDTLLTLSMTLLS
jgi:hypothetical protein